MKKYNEDTLMELSNAIVAILHDYDLQSSELRHILFLIETKQMEITKGLINQDCLFR